jgi:hypothetical protein
MGVSPINLAAGLVPSGFAQSFTELTTPSALAPGIADGYFTNVDGNPGPVAVFTFPSKILQGSTVTFNASGSYDPDASIGAPSRGIALYVWDFGGASALSQSTSHSILIIRLGTIFGNFSVRLTVVDRDNGFEGMQIRPLTVSQTPFLLEASSTAVTIIKGASATEILTLTSLNEFSGNVALSVELSPVVSKNPNASVNPSTLTLSPFFGPMRSVLTISTEHSTRMGDYVVTVTATSGSVSKSIQILVTVAHK